MMTIVTLLNHLIPIVKSLKLVILSENFIKKYRGNVDATTIKVNTRLLLLIAEIEYSLIKCEFSVKSLSFHQCWNRLSTVYRHNNIIHDRKFNFDIFPTKPGEFTFIFAVIASFQITFQLNVWNKRNHLFYDIFRPSVRCHSVVDVIKFA